MAESSDRSNECHDETETSLRALILIPVYNNAATLRKVAEKSIETGLPVLVVNDGSTDGGPDTLDGLDVARIDLPENRGKGVAIRTGAQWAIERGYTHIITLDADGQHDPADVPRFMARLREKPLVILVGARDFENQEIPGGSRFGRKWSNMWMRIASSEKVADSQSGFRAYPLDIFRKIKFTSNRYEFEIDVLIKSAWAGMSIEDIPVSVHYPPGKERVSHFHQFFDNYRISIVYTRSVLRTLWPWPHKLHFGTAEELDRISLKHPLRSIKLLLLERSTPREIAFAVMLGIIIGALPIFGLHSVAILFAATLLRLNRVIAFNSQHICAPPFVPGICIEIGHYMRHGVFLTQFNFQTLGKEIHFRLWEWFLGSLIVGPVLALLVGGMAYYTAVFYQRRMKNVLLRKDQAKAEKID